MRKMHLKDCAPEWHVDEAGIRHSISFDCPEADGGCDGRHRIPIKAGDRGWHVSGELPNVTIVPSILCSGACRMHIQIANGDVSFCADSKSGPDWDAKE